MLRLWEPRVPPLAPERELLFEREALPRLRADGDDFERAEPPEERDDPLRAGLPFEREDPLALVFDPEPLDELRLFCPPREAALLLAITHPSDREIFLRIRYPRRTAITPILGVSGVADFTPGVAQAGRASRGRR